MQYMCVCVWLRDGKGVEQKSIGSEPQGETREQDKCETSPLGCHLDATHGPYGEQDDTY